MLSLIIALTVQEVLPGLHINWRGPKL